MHIRQAVVGLGYFCKQGGVIENTTRNNKFSFVKLVLSRTLDVWSVNLWEGVKMIKQLNVLHNTTIEYYQRSTGECYVPNCLRVVDKSGGSSVFGVYCDLSLEELT